MKELIKFTKDLYLYGENWWLKINQWWLIAIVVLGIGASSMLTREQRWFFLEANKNEMLALNGVIEKLMNQGHYQLARELVKQEGLEGWDQVLNPKERLIKLIEEQEKILRESPYLESALENLADLNEVLGKETEAKHYQKLKWWVNPGK